MDSTSSSKRMQTTQRLLAAYSSLSSAALAASLSDGFTHKVLPESLGMPERARSQFLEHAKGMFSIFSRFEMLPIDTFEDPKRNAVVVQTLMKGILKSDGSEWLNEGVMLLFMNNAGNEIVSQVEWVDSYKAMKMRGEIQPPNF